MEKKIEERLKRIESYLRQADKGTQFAEACSIAQEALYDLKIAISKQPTPSSLPTDEFIEQVDDALEDLFDKHTTRSLYSGDYTEKRDVINGFKKWLRTNFSSEKCEVENEIRFAEWSCNLKTCKYYPLYENGIYKGWCNRENPDDIITTSELYQIFKQEQQTTK